MTIDHFQTKSLHFDPKLCGKGAPDWESSGGATSQFFPRLAHSDTIHISTACQNCVFVFKYLLLTWKQLMVSSFRNPRALYHPKKTEGIPEIDQALGLRAPAILTFRP